MSKSAEGPSVDDAIERLKALEITPTTDAVRAYESGYLDAMDEMVDPVVDLVGLGSAGQAGGDERLGFHATCLP